MSETRDRVLDLVRSEPGVSKSEIARRLGIGWGTVGYHLHRLQKHRLLRIHDTGYRTLVVPSMHGEEAASVFAALREPVNQDLLQSVHEAGDAGLMELADEHGLSRKVVRRRLGQLMQAGLLERQAGHRGRFMLQPRALRDLRQSMRRGEFGEELDFLHPRR